jgi:hypothetical protein
MQSGHRDGESGIGACAQGLRRWLSNWRRAGEVPGDGTKASARRAAPVAAPTAQVRSFPHAPRPPAVGFGRGKPLCIQSGGPFRSCHICNFPYSSHILVAPFGLTVATLHTTCFPRHGEAPAGRNTMRWRPNQSSRLRPDPSTRPSSPNATTLAAAARRTPQLAERRSAPNGPARRTPQQR